MTLVYLSVGLAIACALLAFLVVRLYVAKGGEIYLVPESVKMDPRGWIGLGTYILAVLVIVLTATVPDLRADEFFKTIATLIVGAFIKDVVGWAYSATKSGSELAQTNSRIVADAMANAPSNDNSGNQKPLETDDVKIDAANDTVNEKGTKK